MRLIYHPEAEAELVEAAQFYEQRIPTLGAQFLDAVDRAVGVIQEAPNRWSIIEGGCQALPHATLSLRHLLPGTFRPTSDSRLQAPQPSPRLLARPSFRVNGERLPG
ncbi:MAG: hypothetical protein WDN28_11060 [Chthoniobacter sp.]